MNLPSLYKKTSTGKIQVWKIQVDALPNGAAIHTRYGQLNGKQQVASELITIGKNVGKANETTPLQQAELEAKAQWEKKLANKGYVQSLEDAETGKRDERVVGGIDPMLAHSFEKRSHDIRWPAYVQPKLDGHRCIAVIQDGVCTLWSRQRKPITGVPHIQRQLEAAFPKGQLILDGELYNHDYRDNFEELTSFIRQQTPKPGHEVVQYWIYDTIIDHPFSERNKFLLGLERAVIDLHLPNIVVLPADDAKDHEMIGIFGVYVDHGFEGLMVRNAKGLYVGKRSKDLQKVKIMQDAEYEVVGIEQGKGKMAGLAMFVCKIPCGRCDDTSVDPKGGVCSSCKGVGGKTFRVKMKGTLESLRDYYDDPEPWIGKMLTVQFQKFSAEGVPIFPVALRWREDV